MTRPADAPAWVHDSRFALDLGDGVWSTTVVTRNTDELPYGLIIIHRCTDNSDGAAPDGWRSSSIMFDLPQNAAEKAAGRAAWKVESRDPLTISPSVRHIGDSCPLGHGFIQQGRWVRAP